MSSANCWEVKKCGRELGGINVSSMGVCPAATEKSFNGINRGKAGGRICWAISGTFCGGEVQGSFTKKQLSCMNCDFFKLVKKEEGTANFQLMKV